MAQPSYGGPHEVTGRRGPARVRPLRVTGIVLVLVGLMLAGHVGWQYFGTDWVSGRRHAAIAAEVRAEWDRGRASASVDQGTAGALVRIPAFGEDFVVPVLEGTSDDVLASGFGHFPGTAGPGERGNFALGAHRVTNGQPLRDMPDLEVGDLILVDTVDRTYTYELVTAGDELTVPFTADWVLDPRPVDPDSEGFSTTWAPGARLLTLATCSELFHTDDRLVAFAELVDTSPRTSVSGA